MLAYLYVLIFNAYSRDVVTQVLFRDRIGAGRAREESHDRGKRGSGVYKPPDTFSLGGELLSFSLSLAFSAWRASFSRPVTSRLLHRLGLSTLCLAVQKRSLLRPLAAAKFARRHCSLSSPTVVLHRRSSTTFPPAPSLVPRTPPLLLLLLLLLPAFLLLLLLRSCRSLLLISLFSTSQGPFSRRSLLLTERVLHSRPLSPRIVFT